MSHAEVKEIADKKVLDVAVEPVKETEIHLAGTVTGTGSTVRRRALRIEQHDHAALPAEGSQGSGGGEGIQAGRRDLSRRLVPRLRRCRRESGRSREAGAHGRGAARRAPPVAAHDLDLPRLAIYSIWGNTQEVGWVRYALDKFEVPYDLIYKERVKKGDLKSGLRRHRHAESGRQRQAARLRHREPRPADRVQEERRVQEPRACTASRTTSPAGWGSRASPSSRSSSSRAGCS